MKLENKVVAITGAGGIICSEFAKALAKEGAKVATWIIPTDEEYMIAIDTQELATK